MRPDAGGPGLVVTIRGWNFGATRSAANVLFGDQAATSYISWTASEIKVKVPRHTRGTTSVTVSTPGGKSNAMTFRVT